MGEDTQIERRQGWFKSQITAPNLVGAVMVIVSLVSLYRASEARDEMQDYRIRAMEERQAASEATFVRRDISDQRLSNIEAALQALDKKLDQVRNAVR